jgi:hypothetical protein
LESVTRVSSRVENAYKPDWTGRVCYSGSRLRRPGVSSWQWYFMKLPTAMPPQLCELCVRRLMSYTFARESVFSGVLIDTSSKYCRCPYLAHSFLRRYVRNLYFGTECTKVNVLRFGRGSYWRNARKTVSPLRAGIQSSLCADRHTSPLGKVPRAVGRVSRCHDGSEPES